MASPRYCCIISICIIFTCVHICSWQNIDTLRLYNVVRSIRSPVSLLADLLHRHKASYFIHPFIYSTNIYPGHSMPRHYARYWIDCLGQMHQHGANRPVWANSGVLFEYIRNCALWEVLGGKRHKCGPGQQGRVSVWGRMSLHRLGNIGVEPARDAERSGLPRGFDFLRMGSIGVCTSREWSGYPGAVVPSAGSYRSLSSVLTPHLLCKIGTHPFRGWRLYSLLFYSAWLDQEPSCRHISLWGPTIPQWCVWVGSGWSTLSVTVIVGSGRADVIFCASSAAWADWQDSLSPLLKCVLVALESIADCLRRSTSFSVSPDCSLMLLLRSLALQSWFLFPLLLFCYKSSVHSVCCLFCSLRQSVICSPG